MSELKYVPEHLRDSSYYIFNGPYQCRVKTIDLYSSEHIKEFGLYLTNDEETNQQYLNEWQLVYLTINDMVEIYKRGGTIGIPTPGDSKRIYDRIQAHLERWIKEMNLGLAANVAKAPLDDLAILDEFASTIYEHAVRYFEPTDQGTKLGSLFNSIVPNGKLVVNRVTTAPEGELMPLQPKAPERMSMGTLFNSFKGTSFYSLNDLDDEEGEGPNGVQR